MKLLKAHFLSATVLFVGIAVTCVSLGFWQLERLEWKEARIKLVSVNDPRYFFPVEEVILGFHNMEPEFYKVRVKGHFLHKFEFRSGPRPYLGQNGYNILTPVELPTKNIILVDRGWVPEAKNISIQRPEGEVEFLGYVRSFPKEKSWYTPANEMNNRIMYHLDLKEYENYLVNQHYDYQYRLSPFYIQARPEENQKENFPLALSPSLMLTNNHMQYAITWFLLSLVFISGYIHFAIISYKEGKIPNFRRDK